MKKDKRSGGCRVSRSKDRLDSNRPKLSAVRFTLIELLVVIAIIAVLAGMLLPSLSKAKDHTYAVMCTANFKNMLPPILSYWHDYNSAFPAQWDTLGKYSYSKNGTGHSWVNLLNGLGPAWWHGNARCAAVSPGMPNKVFQCPARMKEGLTLLTGGYQPQILTGYPTGAAQISASTGCYKMNLIGMGINKFLTFRWESRGDAYLTPKVLQLTGREIILEESWDKLTGSHHNGGGAWMSERAVFCHSGKANLLQVHGGVTRLTAADFTRQYSTSNKKNNRFLWGDE